VDVLRPAGINSRLPQLTARDATPPGVYAINQSLLKTSAISSLAMMIIISAIRISVNPGSGTNAVCSGDLLSTKKN
jgi:hypothetical protein